MWRSPQKWGLPVVGLGTHAVIPSPCDSAFWVAAIDPAHLRIYLARMSDFDEIRLQELPASVTHGRDSPEVEQRVVDIEQSVYREIDSTKTKLCVLIGSGLIQLPIWGTFNYRYELFRYLHSRRLCHELWYIPRILLRELDI